MIDIDKLDNELYKSIYNRPRGINYNEIWDRIKNNSQILKEAVQVRRDRFDENDIVKGLAICNAMLIDYESVDNEAYNNLVNSIYTNTDVARIVVDGASNGGYSFLLMSLWNHNLKLTEEQKEFAVNEAMNKIGTTRWKQSEEKLEEKLDSMGINNDNTVLINIGGCLNPIGHKSGVQYINYMFSALDKTQAHGIGEFDIRYHILRNPNWSLDEKKKLIMDFWYNDEEYDEYLEQWEWAIINDSSNFKDELLEKSDLYEYSYDMLLEFYGDKEIVDKIWEEIQFCKQMHQLRPAQWELELNLSRKLI